MKHLENIAETEIPSREIGTGEVCLYEVDKDGKITNKEIRVANPLAGKV